MQSQDTMPALHSKEVSPGRSSRFAHSRWMRVGGQYAIGLALLFLFLRQVDTRQLYDLIRRLDVLPILLALIAYVADFLLRAVRFWVLLVAVSDRPLPWRSVPGPFIASFGLSDLLPLRAGDVFRLFWFQRQMRLGSGAVLGAMIIERCLDLGSLLLLGLITWGALLSAQNAAVLAGLILVVGCSFWLCLRTIPFESRRQRRSGWLARLADGTLDALSTFRILRSLPLSLGLMTLSLLCWMLESLVLIGAWVSLGGGMQDWIKPLAGFVASTMATLVPSLPGHFGTFELLGMETFRRFDVASDFAAAVLLMGHMLLWAPTALFAAIWFAAARGGRLRTNGGACREPVAPRGSGALSRHQDAPVGP